MNEKRLLKYCARYSIDYDILRPSDKKHIVNSYHFRKFDFQCELDNLKKEIMDALDESIIGSILRRIVLEKNHRNH